MVGNDTSLSVVVLNYRTPEGTIRAIKSVEHTTRLSIEPVIVDNFSNDDSVKEISSALPQARIIELPENYGFAAGMNAGIRGSTADFILLLNSDVEALPGSVAAMLEFLQNNSNVGLVAPTLLNRDGSTSRSIVVPPTLFRCMLPMLAKFHYKSLCCQLGCEPLDVEASEGAAVMVRRSVLEKVGLLDQEFFFYHEIDDWCLRMRDNGLRVTIVPQARMMHACGASTKGVRKAARIELKRSEYLLIDKRYGKCQALMLKVKDYLGEAINVISYVCLVVTTLGLNNRFKEKLRLHCCLLAWLTIGMPDRRHPGYIRLFGNWG